MNEHERQNFGGTHIWFNGDPVLGRIDIVTPTTTGYPMPDPRDARIRELEAAVAERDEAMKVLGKAFYGMWGELKDHDATTQTLEDIDTALTNPIARAAVDAAKEKA